MNVIFQCSHIYSHTSVLSLFTKQVPFTAQCCHIYRIWSVHSSVLSLFTKQGPFTAQCCHIYRIGSVQCCNYLQNMVRSLFNFVINYLQNTVRSLFDEVIIYKIGLGVFIILFIENGPFTVQCCHNLQNRVRLLFSVVIIYRIGSVYWSVLSLFVMLF